MYRRNRKLQHLSPRALAVLEAVRPNEGASLREIGEAVGLSSTSTVHAHLVRLQERGLVVKEGCGRAWTAIDSAWVDGDDEDNWQYPHANLAGVPVARGLS